MKKNVWRGFLVMLGLFVVAAVLAIVSLVSNSKKKEGFALDPAPTELVLINLNSRKDRLNRFIEAYNASDAKKTLPLHRIEAVVGKDLDWQDIVTPKAREDLERVLKVGKRKNHDEFPGLGGIGCYLSHLKAMEYVVAQNRPMIVCEDDAQLPPDFYKKAVDMLQRIPPGEKPAMVFFHIMCHGWEKLKCTLLKDNLYELTKFWSLACYYVTPESAKIILDNAKPLDVQIDAKYSEFAEKGLIRMYGYPFVRTYAAGTDIQFAPI